MTAPQAPEELRTQVNRHVDLHMHTTASDGVLPPRDVVRAASAAGLAAIAITDHDTVAGVADAEEEAAAVGIDVIAGVELSAVEGQVETHVLGLHVADVVRLGERLQELRDMRRLRAERIVRRLNDLAVPISFAEVAAQAGGGAIGRPHVARVLVERGFAADFREAFDRYLGAGRPAFVSKDRLSLVEAVGIIHGAGGFAFLAHPGRGATRQAIDGWIGAGMDGIEVLHPSHPDHEIGRIARLVEDARLLPTGGSDWHGQDDGYRRLGMMNVPHAWLERQRDAVGRRRGGQRVA